MATGMGKKVVKNPIHEGIDSLIFFGLNSPKLLFRLDKGLRQQLMAAIADNCRHGFRRSFQVKLEAKDAPSNLESLVSVCGAACQEDCIGR